MLRFKEKEDEFQRTIWCFPKYGWFITSNLTTLVALLLRIISSCLVNSVSSHVTLSARFYFQDITIGFKLSAYHLVTDRMVNLTRTLLKTTTYSRRRSNVCKSNLFNLVLCEHVHDTARCPAFFFLSNFIPLITVHAKCHFYSCSPNWLLSQVYCKDSKLRSNLAVVVISLWHHAEIFFVYCDFAHKTAHRFTILAHRQITLLILLSIITQFNLLRCFPPSSNLTLRSVDAIVDWQSIIMQWWSC